MSIPAEGGCRDSGRGHGSGIAELDRPLCDAERRLMAILEAISGSFLVLDRDWNFAHINREAASLLGRSPEDLIGKNIWEEVPALKGTIAEASYRRALAEQVATRCEFLGPSTGRRHSVEVFPSPEGLFIYGRDTTEQEQAEEELARERQRRQLRETGLELALSHARMVAWESDIEAGVMVASEGCEALWGFRQGTVEDFARQVHPDDLPGVSASWRDAVARDGEFVAEYRVNRPDGLRWYRSRGRIVCAAGGARRMLGITADVTELKKAESERAELMQQLDAERLRLEAVVRNMPVGVLIADAPSGRLLLGNEQAARIWGLDFIASRDVSGYEFYRGSRKDGRPIEPHEWPLARSISAGEIVADEEIDFLRGDGQRRTMTVSSSPITGPDGTVIACVMAFADITERKRAEEALREADRRKDEFLAMLGHELRNPLSAIANAAQVARLSRAEDDRSWSLDVIGRQVGNLTRMIDDLLDVSRVSRGKVRLRREVVDVPTVLARALEAVQPLIAERRHALVVPQSPGSLRVDADPTRLEQVFVNLLTNAAKYTDPEGRIEVAATQEGEEIIISVRDDGMGIAADVLPHIFELFAQGRHAIDRSRAGLGIGLTLVEALVAMHGGTVDAKSGGPGTGSEFTVRLPASHEQAHPARRAADPGPTAADGPRVLVVDDDADSARGFERLLRAFGHEVRTAGDGRSALEIAREFRPNVVLLDLGLPGMTGYEVAGELRKLEGLGQTTIVAVTGYGRESDRARTRAAGFDAHLLKPVDIEALRTLLARRG